MLKKSVIASLLLTALAGVANAQIKPGIVYDVGGKFDKSFNESAYNGMEKFKKETGIAYQEVLVNNEPQREQVLRSMARRGVDIVVAVGFSFSQAMEKVAKEYPKTKFVMVDSVVKGNNILSVTFKEQEGSYLVGMVAAMTTKSKKVGYINAMSMPLMNAFECGYVQGVKYIDPKVEVLSNIVGSTPAAFHDPARGAEIARSQFSRGADITFSVAGPTNLGVLQAAKDAKKLAIGVDANQNYLQPGFVLTSMVKRIDTAVYDAVMAAKNNTFQPGVKVMGLKEGGVDWALDQHNRPLISAAVEKRVVEARKAIIDGKINVVDFRANNSCPVR
ncbi:MAG TPA: BMP family ABC transporter substrate-binding protein [Burkholderiaceae bacterium]